MKTVVILFSFMILSIAPTFASQHPFFEISNSQKRELVANALKINIGDSYRQVRTTLGAPTRETPITQKNTRGYIGKKIEYYAVIWKKNIVNELTFMFSTFFLEGVNYKNRINAGVLLNRCRSF